MKLVKFKFLSLERHVYFSDAALEYLPQDPEEVNRLYEQLCLQMISAGIFNNDSVIELHVSKLAGDETAGFAIAYSDGAGYNTQNLAPLTKSFNYKIEMVTVEADKFAQTHHTKVFQNQLFKSYDKILYDKAIAAFESGKITPQYRMPQPATEAGIVIDTDGLTSAEAQTLQLIAETDYSDRNYKSELLENKKADFAKLKADYIGLATRVELFKRHLARAIYTAGVEYLNAGLNDSSINRVKLISDFNKKFKPFIQVNSAGRITTIEELYSDISYINLEAMVKIINESLLVDDSDTAQLVQNAIALIPKGKQMLMYSDNDGTLLTTRFAKRLEDELQLILESHKIEVDAAKKIRNKPPIKQADDAVKKRKKRHAVVILDDDSVRSQDLQSDSSSDELTSSSDSTHVVSIPRPIKAKSALSRDQEKALAYFNINLTEIREQIAKQQETTRQQLTILEGNKKNIAAKIDELTKEITALTDSDQIKNEMKSHTQSRITEIRELLKRYNKEIQEIDRTILRLNELSSDTNVEKQVTLLKQEIVKFHHDCLIEEDLKSVIIGALYAAATEYYQMIIANFDKMDLEDQYSKILEFNEKFKPIAIFTFDHDNATKKIIPKPLSSIETASAALMNKSFKEIEMIISNSDTTKKGMLQRCDTSATPLTKSNATKVMLKHLELAKNAYHERFEHPYGQYFREPAFTFDRYEFRWNHGILDLTTALGKKAHSHRTNVANWFAAPATDDVSRIIETSNQLQKVVADKVDEAVTANTVTLSQLRDATAKIEAHIKEAEKYETLTLTHINPLHFNLGILGKKIKEIEAFSTKLVAENSELRDKLWPGLRTCVSDELSLRQPLLEPINDEIRKIKHEIDELISKLESTAYTQKDIHAELAYRDALKEKLLVEFSKLDQLKEKTVQYEAQLIAYHEALIAQQRFESTVKEANVMIATSLTDANFNHQNTHLEYEFNTRVKSPYDADPAIIKLRDEIKEISKKYLTVLKDIQFNRDSIAIELNEPLKLIDNNLYKHLTQQQQTLITNLNTIQQTLAAKNVAVSDRIAEIRRNQDDAADIARCKQYIAAIKDLPYWHNHVSFFGGTKVRINPQDNSKKMISVPSGIAKMLNVITSANLLTNDISDADQARTILTSLKAIAEEREKKNAKLAYSFFHIRDASTDAVYRAILQEKEIPQNITTEMAARPNNRS